VSLYASDFLSDDALDFLSGASDVVPPATAAEGQYAEFEFDSVMEFFEQLTEGDEGAWATPQELRDYYADLIIPETEADPSLLRGQVFFELEDALVYIATGGLEGLARVVVRYFDTVVDASGKEEDLFVFLLEVQKHS
jgi:hypothetical protein